MKSYNPLQSNIWKLYLTSFLGNLEFIAPYFVLFYLANSLNMTQVFLLQTFFVIVIFAFEVPSGVIADLFGRKYTIATSYFISAVSMVMFALSSTFLGFLIAEFLVGLSWALYSGADSAFVYDTLKAQKKESLFRRVMGRVTGFAEISIGIAGLISALFVLSLGYRILFYLSAASFLLGFFFCLSLREPPYKEKSQDRRFFQHLKEGVRYTKHHAIIMKYVFYASFLGGFSWMCYFVMQPYLEQALSVSFVGYGVGGYIFAVGLGYFSTSWWSKRIKKDDSFLLFIFFFSSVFFLIVSFISPYLAILLLFLYGFFNSVSRIFTDHAVHIHTPSSHRATVLSVKSMGRNLVFAIIAPLVGYAIDLYDVPTTLLSMGVALLLMGCYVSYLFYTTKT